MAILETIISSITSAIIGAFVCYRLSVHFEEKKAKNEGSNELISVQIDLNSIRAYATNYRDVVTQALEKNDLNFFIASFKIMPCPSINLTIPKNKSKLLNKSSDFNGFLKKYQK